MPDPLQNLTEFAEDAISDLRLIVHEYVAVRTGPAGTAAVGRFGATDQGFGDRGTQFALANIVAVVEQYAEQVLLHSGADPKKVKDWTAKLKVWKTMFGTNIEDVESCPAFAPMRGFYEARTAIMHRRGELTDSQRKPEVYARLAAANIERVGYKVVVSDSTVLACADVCVRCVKELDATVKSVA